jgi:LacI family transcriptional regulator
LKANESGLVGVLVADLRNGFYAEVACGVEEVLAASEYVMVLATDHRSLERQGLAVRTFASMQVAGVILTPSYVSGAVAKDLVSQKVAVVEIDERTVDVKRSAAVMVDGVTGVRQAVQHLIEQGHRRIAGVLWDVERQAGAERRDGYLDALRAAGLSVQDAIVRTVPDGSERARLATHDLLERRDEFTAIVATNELVCRGVMEALGEAGVRVPQELSVIGFDDAPWMRMTTPAVTTVAQPTMEIGRFAANAMISLLEGSDPPAPITRLAPSLVLRGSVSGARNDAKSQRKAAKRLGGTI